MRTPKEIGVDVALLNQGQIMTLNGQLTKDVVGLSGRPTGEFTGSVEDLADELNSLADSDFNECSNEVNLRSPLHHLGTHPPKRPNA